METALAIKVYEVDYSFIISNYLDKELWGKSWTLFEYRDYIFKLNLASIDAENNTIVFKIKCDKLVWNFEADVYDSYKTVRHNVENSNIEILKRQINSAIYDAIDSIERIKIVETKEYQNIENYRWEERTELKKIAEEFLDDNNVSNDEIREAYIDKYISNNSTISSKKRDYLINKKYNVLTDLRLVFVRAIKDEQKEARILENLDETKAEKVLQEVNEYMEKLETEEYQEELKGELEDI